MLADPAGDLPAERGTLAGAVVGDHPVDGPAGLVVVGVRRPAPHPRTRC